MASNVESADLIENDVLAAVGVAAVVGLALTGPRGRHHIHIPTSRYDQLLLCFDAATDIVDIGHSAH